MKVEISDKYQFTAFFENKLKVFLKEEFIKIVGMEVPVLYFPSHQEISIDQENNITSVQNFSLSWYSGGSIGLQNLAWRSVSVKNYTGREELANDDVEIWQEGLELFAERLRKNIPLMFKKQFWLGYRFIVEVQDMVMDTLLTIEAEKDKFEIITSFIEESVHKWNQLNNGLIHGIFPIKNRNNKLKIRIDTGSSGEYGIKAIIQDLSNSKLDLTKIIISNSN